MQILRLQIRKYRDCVYANTRPSFAQLFNNCSIVSPFLLLHTGYGGHVGGPLHALHAKDNILLMIQLQEIQVWTKLPFPGCEYAAGKLRQM